MSVEIYKTPVGYVNFIVDDSVYDFVVNNIPTSVLHIWTSVGGMTEIGTTLKAYLSAAYTTYTYRASGEIPQTLINMIYEITPNSTLKGITPPTGTSYSDAEHYERAYDGGTLDYWCYGAENSATNMDCGTNIVQGSTSTQLFYAIGRLSGIYTSSTSFANSGIDIMISNEAKTAMCSIGVQCLTSVTPNRMQVSLKYKSRSDIEKIANFLNNSTPTGHISDPYEDSGSESGSGGGGGGGLDSVSGSDVSDPDLPELSAVSTGLVSIFTPSLAQLQALGNFLWSDLFSLDTFKKIFTDPWDAILGLSILGVGVSSGTPTAVNIGNVSTDVSMPKLSTQYYKFNCGSITLKETWGSYLDYNPYTKVSVYLPFIGTHALNVDDIMGKTISLKYNIDVLSGACVANIQCGGSVLYSFTGSCSATIPLSGSSYTNMINGILGIATSIGATVATGGAAAPVAATSIVGSAMSSLKTDVSRTGNVTGMAGIMGVKSAYLIMEVPRICIPKNQDKYIGYPTYVTKKVGDLSGYCVFEDIKVRGNSHATIGEIEEIESIMKEGVYL